ncbi:RluA family pseudouridine synthase [Lactobacillus reuteri]|uniref:RluA family pseudouridine synthase n=1 Tax=Limosilactobacillus reuteri TaxID=1598 RepID=UPI00146A452C|nr:RluA family pseudouridine synthase [Limosilactobacillus reuteri]NMV48105.1 RluA family pseudouridine synthase [Limosilactobacillus reuteri]NMV49878.1 RluA family pseudouridine synthase [Limosilactobacillus reuteri]NMV58920.1 RluA family pseudouridine synthase [Limosilactobacillus reuteri]NMV60729.1 RluA family pseudouridine synthase [Limosilactobacillus reuteri]NMV62481.1 RluA family pseudouridine synthase [Limosilactobacillus reuteri]
MENTWIYQGTEPIKIKKYLQSLGMGHRLFNDLKNGEGEFLVDHRKVRPTTQILPNQPLTIKAQPELADDTVEISNEPLKIVYEDDNWLVVDKPAGVTSIPGPTVQNNTVLNRVKGYLIANNSADLRPHLITRLDRFTGGLLLIAKHHIASSMISQQVQQHQMLKEYTALVEGQIMDEHGEINKPIGRKNGQAARVIDENGQRALTEYWVEERDAKWTRVRVRLHTGRTHQIRVHFAAIGHPLIGDHLYGGDTSKYDHQLLHASKISFNDPFTLKQRTFTSELPPVFLN